jgi:hypothetical protein
MSDFLRKHKRLIWGVVLVPLIAAFILFFGAGDWFSLSNRATGGAGGDVVLMPVGPVPVTRGEFVRQMRGTLEQRKQSNPNAKMSDLINDGTQNKVMQGLISNALLTIEADKSGLAFDQSYIEEQIRDNPQFKGDDGTFDPEIYAAWIDSMEGANWKAYYDGVSDDIKQRLLVEQIVASARVLEPEVRKQFEEEYTKFKVKYATIAPKVEPTDEEVAAYFEQHKDEFKTDPQRSADFVAVSIKPAKPDFLAKLVERARAGEDFSALAKEFKSEFATITETLLPWLVVNDQLPEHQKALQSLKVNEVSDPVDAFESSFIYKITEERIQEGTGAREVLARQIVVEPSLTPAQRIEREELAHQIAADANQTGDLAAAAAKHSLAVLNTGLFSNSSQDISLVDPRDVYTFKQAVLKLGTNEISPAILAQANFYIAKVSNLVDAKERTLDEARADVVKTILREKEMSPEYREKVDALSKDVAAKAKSLADIQTMFPELQTEVKEAPEFSVREFNYSDGLFWNPKEIVDAVGKGEPGTFGGPVRDMLGKTYFVELAGKTPPDEAAWEANKKNVRDSAKMMAQSNRTADYSAALLERASSEYPISADAPSLLQTLRDLAAEDAPPPSAEAVPAPAVDPADAGVSGEAAPATAETAPAADAAPAPAEPAPATDAAPAPAEPAPTTESAPAPAEPAPSAETAPAPQQ